MFKDRNSALVPFKDQKLTRRKRSEIAQFGGNMLSSIDGQIHDLATTMIDSYDRFELTMLGHEIDAWDDRRGMVQEWLAKREAAEELLYEAYLRHRKQLFEHSDAINLLAEAEGVIPVTLQNSYETFRGFVQDHGHRIPTAQRVLEEDNQRSYRRRKQDLKKRLEAAERRMAKKTFG